MKTSIMINGYKTMIRHNGNLLFAICDQLSIPFIEGRWLNNKKAIIRTENSTYYVEVIREYLRG